MIIGRNCKIMALNNVSRICRPRLPLYALRTFSISSALNEKYNCKFLVVGGGSAGCAMASKITMDHPQQDVIVLEPNNVHYYQPLFTLVGAGIKKLKSSFKQTKDVLPSKAKWVKDSVSLLDPAQNEVQTSNGHSIKYEYMILATGLQLNYNLIPGLEDSLANSSSGVCSIYSPKYVEDTWKTMQSLKGGEAIFTFPNTPVKCPGAPQKIMYLTDNYLRSQKRRDKVKISYYTSLPVLFGVKKYADSLWEVVKKRDLNVNLRRNLIEIIPSTHEAVFQDLDKPDNKITVNYNMLHVTPPMGPLTVMKSAGDLVNESGFVTVDKFTLQHTKYKNIFGLGDCTDSPNSKTAAAAAAQSYVVQMNLRRVVRGEPLTDHYDGYASCPLVTSDSKCILAEFNYELHPTETFPFNQGRELHSMYLMKKYAMPLLYWQLMTRGLWNGPETLRKLMKPFKMS